MKEKLRALRCDISVEVAEGVLSSFSGNLQQVLLAETTWLGTAFQELRVLLLPSLLVFSLFDLASPSLR